MGWSSRRVGWVFAAAGAVALVVAVPIAESPGVQISVSPIFLLMFWSPFAFNACVARSRVGAAMIGGALLAAAPVLLVDVLGSELAERPRLGLDLPMVLLAATVVALVVEMAVVDRRRRAAPPLAQ